MRLQIDDRPEVRAAFRTATEQAIAIVVMTRLGSNHIDTSTAIIAVHFSPRYGAVELQAWHQSYFDGLDGGFVKLASVWSFGCEHGLQTFKVSIDIDESVADANLLRELVMGVFQEYVDLNTNALRRRLEKVNTGSKVYIPLFYEGQAVNVKNGPDMPPLVGFTVLSTFNLGWSDAMVKLKNSAGEWLVADVNDLMPDLYSLRQAGQPQTASETP